MLLRYWLYENWKAPRARVHRATCGHCNNGEGKHEGAGDLNGHWIGPFSSAVEAFGSQRRTRGIVRPTWCPWCRSAEIAARRRTE